MFLNRTSQKYDKKRKMAEANESLKHLDKIVSIVETIAGKGLSISPETLILSEPNGGEQQPHLDFPAEDAINNRVTFVGIMDGSKLIIFHEGCKFTVNYNKGDILVMRGDVIHCGASYSEWNVRLHFYHDCKNRQNEDVERRSKNTTYYIDDHNIHYKDGIYSSAYNNNNEIEISVVS
jgi:hypothetical protein